MDYAENPERLQPVLDKMLARQPVLMVALGDSNTCNVNFTDGAKQWPELLQEGLKGRYGYQELFLFNAGICGDTVQDAGRRLERDVLRYHPDLVVVCFGTNDRRLDIETFRREFVAVCERLERAGATVLLRTTIPIMERNPAPAHVWKDDQDLRERLEVVRTVARERKLALFDTYRAWVEAEASGALHMGDVMKDEVHSNAAGHRLVFEQLLVLFPKP